MHKLLVPVIVLATVALSSSNILPTLSMDELNAEPIGYDYQHNDNTYSNNHQTRNKLNAILFNIDIDPENEEILSANYMDNNEDFDSASKDDNYNVKGFRKEQWHNYPRQLDRLNRYFYEQRSTDKRNLDPDDPSNSYQEQSVDRLEKSLEDITPNEYEQENDPNTRKIKNEADVAAAVINPLLIFRIHLACYKDRTIDLPLESFDLHSDNLRRTNEEVNSLTNELNPVSNLIKVKREGKINLEDVETTRKSSKNPTVNKRIFSLWSRLQSLNPKGHQLHHRRHLYALYGPPDSEGGGGGVLTAETRAAFMRPPGSPLRWG